ncbi:MAG: VOC family protein [Pseudomonadota bacterium]
MSQHPVRGIDHVFALVNSLDESEAAYRKLGFTISPRGFHSAHMGTANHTIMFESDYFELLGVVASTPSNAPREQQLARDGEGLRAIACRIDDAAAAEAALGEIGIATNGLADFSRPVTLPGGGEGTAAFTTLQFHPSVTPIGIMFMCQQRTRETVWVPELMVHENAAVGLGGVIAPADDPDKMAPRFAQLYASGEANAVAGGMAVTTGTASAPILVLTPAAIAARYEGLDLSALPKNGFAGVQVASADMDKTRAALAASGAPTADTADGIAVAPSAGSGVIIEFVPR